MFTDIAPAPCWAELSHADRVRLVAQEFALSGWPRTITEALEEAADALEGLGRSEE
jgi:hypothetical protein